MGLLQRFGHDPQIIHLRELTVEGQTFFGPGPRDDIDGFPKTRPTLFHVNADPIKFLTLVATAYARFQASPTQHVEHGEFLRHQDGVVQWQNHHGRADPQAPGARRHVASKAKKARE